MNAERGRKGATKVFQIEGITKVRVILVLKQKKSLYGKEARGGGDTGTKRVQRPSTSSGGCPSPLTFAVVLPRPLTRYKKREGVC